MKNSSNDDIDKLIIGGVYSIPDVLHFLNKDHNVKIGHCVILSEHLYHLGHEELKKVKEAIEQSDSLLKKGLPNVTILAMIEPRKGLFKKYYNLCENIEEDVSDILRHSDFNRGAAVLSSDILKKVHEFDRNIVIKDVNELIEGMDVYFLKKGISVRRYSDKYLIFKYSV